MPKLRDLAARADFQRGPLSVSPSRRLVTGPGGEASLEPLIMQVFLLLLDSDGRVVTRDELFDQCWGGVIVGDDSLNRAIGRVRRIAGDVAPGLFEIETIPRTGYRLTGEILEHRQVVDLAVSDHFSRLDRRTMVAGGIAAVAALGGAGWWWASGRSEGRDVDALLERGEEALRLEASDADAYFERAVQLAPDSARAWGLLAYVRATKLETQLPSVPAETVREAESAARSALELDPNQPDALLAKTALQSQMLDWLARENSYLRVLAIDPENTRAMRSLSLALHGVGRCREALAMTERALSIHPLILDMQIRKALRLWVVGRTADADRVIDRTLELWPSHGLVRMARLLIYAFTGRARAALAMVEDEEASPMLLSSSAASVWRSSLRAFETAAPSDIAAARDDVVEASRATPAVAAYGILILSALGELDSAFEVTNGFLLGRGEVIVRPRPEAKVPAVNQPGWRNTFGLFTPPTKAMRLDPRFKPLVEGLGLTEYWRKRGIGPDAFLFKS